MKKHNFSAGPCILPQEVLKKASEAIINFNNDDLSLIEISHRSNSFVSVMEKARALSLELLGLENKGYKALFLQGGASLEFLLVAYNLLNKKAAYLNTGTWSDKAIKEAKSFGELVEVASSKDKKYRYIPKGYEECQVTHKEFFGDFKEFLIQWHEYDDEDLKDNKIGYYDNPNSKYDWYQIGGRFSGLFQAKNKDEAKNGEKSWTNKDLETKGFDIIQKKNIDIEAMIEKAKKETEKYWNVLLKYYPDLTKFPTKSWQDYISEWEKNHKEFNREEVKKNFENQENYDKDIIAALNKELNLLFDNPINFYCKGNKEDFHKKMLYNQFGTFAILKDKFWYQKGQLGWFGTCEKEDKNWEETYYEILESINDEDWLTVIDYHC